LARGAADKFAYSGEASVARCRPTIRTMRLGIEHNSRACWVISSNMAVYFVAELYREVEERRMLRGPGRSKRYLVGWNCSGIRHSCGRHDRSGKKRTVISSVMNERLLRLMTLGHRQQLAVSPVWAESRVIMA
jgi:hypothetical protein